MKIIQFLCLFLGIWFTIVNIIRAYMKNNISGMNTFYQAIGIAGFVYITWFM